MSYAQNSKIVDKFEAILNVRGLNFLGIAAEMRTRESEFQEDFFELALTFIQEVADAHSGDLYTPQMRINRDTARKLNRVIQGK